MMLFSAHSVAMKVFIDPLNIFFFIILFSPQLTQTCRAETNSTEGKTKQNKNQQNASVPLSQADVKV